MRDTCPNERPGCCPPTPDAAPKEKPGCCCCGCESGVDPNTNEGELDIDVAFCEGTPLLPPPAPAVALKVNACPGWEGGEIPEGALPNTGG